MDLGFGLLVLGNVGEVGDVVHRRTIGASDRLDRQHFGIYLAVFPPIPDFALPVPLFAQRRPHLLVERRIMAPGLEQRRRFSDHFIGAVAGESRKGAIDLQNDAVRIGDDGTVLGIEGDRGNAQFGL